MSERILLAIDAGGTRTRARLYAPDGRRLGEGVAGPGNLRFGIESALGQASRAAHAAAAAGRLPPGTLARAYAVLGFAGATEPALATQARAQALPFARALIVSDAEIACCGAHGGEDGAIVIVGTGVCGFLHIRDRREQVSGWGFPVSDEGGGAWLGCEAVRRTLWAIDGRAPMTPLLGAVADAFGRDPHAVVAWMTQATTADYAAHAPTIVAHARMGEEVALGLMREAAGHVGGVADGLLARGASRLSLVGGLSRAMRDFLPDRVAHRLSEPEGDALHGAFLMARAAFDPRRARVTDEEQA